MGSSAASSPVEPSDPLTAVTAAVTRLAAMDLTAVPATAVGEQVTALGHLIDQLEAQRLRRLAVFDRAGGAAADGSPSTAAWLRERAGLGPGAARERILVARELADRRAVTAAALASGRLSYTAAKEISLGLREVPADLPADAADAVEAVLVEQAPALAPGDIRRLLTRTLDALAPGALPAREERVHAHRGVRLSPLGDGWALSGDLTAECGAALDVALRALLSGLPPAPEGEPRPTLPQRRHDALQALAGQLLDAGTLPPQGPDTAEEPAETADALDRAAGPAGPAAPIPTPAGPAGPPGPGRLPDVGGERPHLLIIADLALLQHVGGPAAGPAPAGGPVPPSVRLVPAAELHGSGPISAELARRLACDASLTRVVVDTRPGRPPDPDHPPGTIGARPSPPGLDLDTVRALLPPALGGPVSQVLDVGRRHRTVPPATRRAVLARDRGCRWPGCAHPTSGCEVHHLWHWADGGPTDLANLLLLCWPHHRLLHEGGWTLRLRPDGTVDLRRPDSTSRREAA